MSFERMKSAALLGVVTIAVMVVTAAAGTALGGGARVASASPSVVPQGTIGIGALKAGPVGGPVSAEDKIPGADSVEKPAALLKVAKRKDVPVPKRAKPTRSQASVGKRASSGSSSSRATSSGSGWKSATVSWYGPGFYGHTMAGGGTLRPDSMVVAHRSLAFGTRVQFSYGGRSCTAVVMDRGPHVGGRLFDLGPGTAKALGFSGVGTVKYRILGR
ncbi:MAG: septal ring lytic transglycosylase RlpA family protein [Coriobacteriia bacterium]|nr:septal ring lytic transglycosylase RlpA family protein [Coriobacteriia bacterium]